MTKVKMTMAWGPQLLKLQNSWMGCGGAGLRVALNSGNKRVLTRRLEGIMKRE